jgi:hypothetical protein
MYAKKILEAHLYLFLIYDLIDLLYSFTTHYSFYLNFLKYKIANCNIVIIRSITILIYVLKVINHITYKLTSIHNAKLLTIISIFVCIKHEYNIIGISSIHQRNE